MSKKKIIGTIAVIAVTGIVLITMAAQTVEPRQNLTIVEKGLRIAASPFQYGLSALDDWAGQIVFFFADKERLQRENDTLKQEISLLNNEVDELKNAGLENIRLKEMLGYQTETTGQYALQLAKIIAENNNNLQHTVLLDKGSNDGIVSGMTVINQYGLVGRIIVVQADSCEVILLSDRESAVGARVWETREAIGVVEGAGNDHDPLELIHLPHDADIYVGDDIITSGLDGVFPAGIHIGEVSGISFDANGLTKTAYVQPYVDFAKLEEVFILTSYAEGGSGQ